MLLPCIKSRNLCRVWLALLCSLPAYGVAEERICKPVAGEGRNYEMRWVDGATLELRGKLYVGNTIHWLDNGGWRTGGKYYRTAGFDEQGVHHIYLHETRYEYDPGVGTGGRLYEHITKRLTDPEDEAKVKQQRYDHPLPENVLAREPIQTTGFDRGTTHSMHIADCAIVADGTLKMASDYSLWDIFLLYMKDAIEAEKTND